MLLTPGSPSPEVTLVPVSCVSFQNHPGTSICLFFYKCFNTSGGTIGTVLHLLFPLAVSWRSCLIKAFFLISNACRVLQGVDQPQRTCPAPLMGILVVSSPFSIYIYTCKYIENVTVNRILPTHTCVSTQVHPLAGLLTRRSQLSGKVAVTVKPRDRLRNHHSCRLLDAPKHPKWELG